MKLRVDWEREYQNVPAHPESHFCNRCVRNVPTTIRRDYESMREPNRSHPEWFHVIDRRVYIDIVPRSGFEHLAVETIYICCGECGKTLMAY